MLPRKDMAGHSDVLAAFSRELGMLFVFADASR